jgi:hypothetical protein
LLNEIQIIFHNKQAIDLLKPKIDPQDESKYLLLDRLKVLNLPLNSKPTYRSPNEI